MGQWSSRRSTVTRWCTWSSRNHLFFFCNDPATTEIYTLSLHDALPISSPQLKGPRGWFKPWTMPASRSAGVPTPSPTANAASRSEEHTSELQSQFHLVCRLLLEKKKDRTEKVPLSSTDVPARTRWLPRS